MPAGTLNLEDDYRVEQGATYEFEITVTDDAGDVYDLSGASAAAQIRETYDSATSYAFTCSINTTTGVISCSMADTITETIDFTEGVWDIELTETDGTVTRLFNGTVEISLEVTKS
jgi:hypothetical protein